MAVVGIGSSLVGRPQELKPQGEVAPMWAAAGEQLVDLNVVLVDLVVEQKFSAVAPALVCSQVDFLVLLST